MASSSRNNRRFVKSSSEYNQTLHQRHVSRSIARHSCARYTMTLVGSMASGLGIRGSDHDVLIEPRNIAIDESILVYRRDLPCYVRIPTMQLTGIVPRVLMGNGKYMRADPLRNMSGDIFGGTTSFQGSTKVGQVSIGSKKNTTDFVPQLRLSGLPSAARSFVSRDRSWPPTEVISLISNGEFHVTARPAPYNPDPLHDYCLSFAKAEVLLSRTMSVNQLLSIRFLKKIRECVDGGKGIITSYLMKTAALWHYEQTKPEDWIIDRPVVGILTRVDRYLNERFLPHYFVSEMNLLAGVSESTLIDIRRSLWSFLGCYLIADDIAGMRSCSKLFLAQNMIVNVGTCMQFRFNAGIDHIYSIIKAFGAAETMYGVAGNSPNKDLRQQVSESIMRICPTVFVRRAHVDKFKQLHTSFNNMINSWVRSRDLLDNSELFHKMFMWFIGGLIAPTVEPLDEYFGFKFVQFGSNSRGARLRLQRVDDTMKKWLAFTDDIISRLKSYENNIADRLLGQTLNGSRGDKHMDTEWRKYHIDTMLNQVTTQLLSFAVDNIEAVFSSMYTGAHVNLFRTAAVDDSPANIHMLLDAFDRWFMHVEYAIVISVRLKGAAATRDHSKQALNRILGQTSVEYQCFSAYGILSLLIQQFEEICYELYGYRGWMEFITTTTRSDHDIKTPTQ